MTREEYAKLVEAFQKEYDSHLEKMGEVVDKEHELTQEYLKENMPYPIGTTIRLRLRREDGTPRRSIIGKIKDWHVTKTGEMRPHFDNHPYSWHDVIISMERYEAH